MSSSNTPPQHPPPPRFRGAQAKGDNTDSSSSRMHPCLTPTSSACQDVVHTASWQAGAPRQEVDTEQDSLESEDSLSDPEPGGAALTSTQPGMPGWERPAVVRVTMQPQGTTPAGNSQWRPMQAHPIAPAYTAGRKDRDWSPRQQGRDPGTCARGQSSTQQSSAMTGRSRSLDLDAICMLPKTRHGGREGETLRTHRFLQ